MLTPYDVTERTLPKTRLEEWAKLESKSDATEHDLLRGHEDHVPSHSWNSAVLALLHVVQFIVSNKTES